MVHALAPSMRLEPPLLNMFVKFVSCAPKSLFQLLNMDHVSAMPPAPALLPITIGYLTPLIVQVSGILL